MQAEQEFLEADELLNEPIMVESTSLLGEDDDLLASVTGDDCTNLEKIESPLALQSRKQSSQKKPAQKETSSPTLMRAFQLLKQRSTKSRKAGAFEEDEMLLSESIEEKQKDDNLLDLTEDTKSVSLDAEEE